MKRLIIIISVLVFVSVQYAQTYKPGDHEVFFMPTAETMPKGSAYFSDYEVLFLNYTFAPTNSTHIGLFTIFPVTTRFFETVTLGVKQGIYSSENFGTALFGSVMLREGLFIIGDVLSLGDESKSIHAGFALAGGGDSDDLEALLMLGGKINISENVLFMAEFSSTGKMLDSDIPGLLTLGIRFRGENSSWDIAGVRPLGETNDEFIAYPFLKATFYF